METINKESLTTAHNEPVFLRQQFNNPTMKQSSLKYFLYGFFGLFLTIVVVFILYSISNLLGDWSLPNSDEKNSTATTNASPLKKLSKIATEASFLETEKELQNLNKDHAAVDLSEPKLSLPILEMNVNFEK